VTTEFFTGVYTFEIFDVAGVLTTFLTGVETLTGAGAGVLTFFTADAAEEIALVVAGLGIVAKLVPVTSLLERAIAYHQFAPDIIDAICRASVPNLRFPAPCE